MTLRNPAPSFFPCKQHGQEIVLLWTPLLKTALLLQHREELRCGNWHGRSPLGLSPCSTRWHGAGMGPRVLGGHTKCPSQLSTGPAADSHFQFLLLLITTHLLQIRAMLSPGIPHGWLWASWSKTHLLPLLPNFPPTSARAGVSQEPAQKLSLGFCSGGQELSTQLTAPGHGPCPLSCSPAVPCTAQKQSRRQSKGNYSRTIN